MKFIDLAKQQARLKPQIDAALQKVLAHGQFILGPEVYELEEKLAEYTGAKYCITCANGTDALQIALMALEIGSGHEVVTPGFGYIAAAEAASLLGATPIYVDIQPDTFNLDSDLVESCISDKTKAIIPISLYGQPSDMNRINEIAGRYSIPVIEDAAQSFGAIFEGRRSCNLSTMAITSFFPSKPLGCYGDGGAIFTSDNSLAKAARKIRQHGQTKRYMHDRIGLNSRLDTIQAAILLTKLSVFDEELESRALIADEYERLLHSSGVIPPRKDGKISSAWAQYTIRCDGRNELQRALGKKNIPATVYYPIALNKQKAIGCLPLHLPVSERATNEVLSLPMHPYLTPQSQSLIAGEIISFYQEYQRLK